MKKYIIFWVALVFLHWGCQQKIVQTGFNAATYVKVFPEPKPKNFLFSVFVSYDSLSKWIEQRPDKTIFESKSDQSWIGFPIKSSIVGPVRFFSNNSNHLALKVPAILEAKPNVAGFNAGVVRGKLDLNVGLDLQIKSINKFEVADLNYSYQWLEKPTIKVAGFGVNVGPLVDNLFKTKYKDLTLTIKSNLEDLLKPTSLEKIIVNNAQNIRWPSNVFPTNDVGLGIKKLDLTSQGISFDLLINTSIGFSTFKAKANNSVRYYLNNDPKVGRELPFSGQLEWLILNEILTKSGQEKFKNKALKIQINGQGLSYLSAKINGFKGQKSELKIDFVPIIFDDHLLGFQVIHQEINGLSFPRSLFKNRVIKRINLLANEFKFDLMKSPDLIQQFSSSVALNNTNLKIDQIHWNESGLHINGLLGVDLKISK